jgi:hypothetical protein
MHHIAAMRMLFLFLFLGFALLTRFAQAEGVSGGGGGTSVIYQGRRVFLDLLMIPSLRERVVKAAPTPVEDPVQAADEALKKWDEKVLAVESGSVLMAFANSVKWSHVSNELPLVQRYYLPPELELSEPRTVAYYEKSAKSYTVKFSDPRLNELDGLSQAAVGVHEYLRHRQIALDPDGAAFDERALQEVTAIYVLCKPSNALGMYANLILDGRRAEANQLYGDGEQFVANRCKAGL